MKTIRYENLDDEELVVSVDQIVRLSKDWEGDITLIHLANGEVIRSRDSMKTLEARIN